MSEKKENDFKNNNEMIINEEIKEELTEELIFNKLIYSKEALLFQEKYSNNIIDKYMSELENKRKIISNKRRLRDISYLEKFLNNNKKIEMNIKNIKDPHKILAQFFISFNKNIYMTLSNLKKEKSKENNIKINYLYYLLKILLKMIGLSYISGLIKDDLFELLIKNTLHFSSEKVIDIKKKKIEVLKHMMFFNGCIQIIKIVFNKLFLVQKKYSEKQKEIIKNIIIQINCSILDSSSKESEKVFENKGLLCLNDYKTSLLNDLAYIIIRMKSDIITEVFLNLLSNIYYFSFYYENCMKSILKFTEPLLLNLNKKNLDEIHNELDLSDFILNYINALNNKEKEIFKSNSYILKEGIYFGNKKDAYLCGDINNNFENDFLILFSFRLDSDDLENVVIFELYNEEKTELKIFLNKNLKNNYEMYAKDGETESTTKIIIYPRKNYIFAFLIMTEGFRRNKVLRIKYIKDEMNEDQDNQNINIISGAAIKLKNLDTNIKKICIACERKKYLKQETFENKFVGFIGDFIILNAKRVKDNIESKLYDEILKMKQKYSDIIYLLSDEHTLIEDASSYLEYNSIFNKSKEIYENLKKKMELKANHTINTIISSKYFKLIEYQDDIDYMNSINNYDSRKLEIPKTIKLKYLNYKTKPDATNKKNLTINTSLFNKQFHLFETKFSLIQFVKYEGIHYLSLIFEYYYQILCYLMEIKDSTEQNILKELYKKISDKIIKGIAFFHVNIIQTNLCEFKLVEMEQFFYQMTSSILKLAELEDLDFELIKSITEVINSLHQKWDKNRDISLIKIRLIEFLINPRIYNSESNSCLLKLNYIFNYLLTFFKKAEIIYLNKLFCDENLEMLLSYNWLLDEPKDKEHFEETKNNYTSLLILFIQISTYLSLEDNQQICFTNEIKNENSNQNATWSVFNIPKNKGKNNQENLIISAYFQKILRYKKNHHIFLNLSLILLKTNFICFLTESDIKDAKNAFLYEIQDTELFNSESKKTLYFSYLQILIPYYFSETKYKDKTVTLKQFNEFVNIFNLDIDLFYAFISLFRSINKFRKINQVELNSFMKEDLQIISKDDYPIFSDLPFREIKIDKLTEIEIYIIRNILLDVLFLLDKYEKKLSFKFNLNEEKSSSKDNEPTMGKEFFEILKKNIDIVFKFPRTKLYETLFSCESNICSKLFLIKWKNGLEKDINYIKTVLKKYYKELVKCYYSPFIYKFLLEIIKEKNLRPEIQTDNSSNNVISEFKSEMIIYIISILSEFSKEVDTSKEKLPFYVYNLLNCLILLNEILNYKSDLIFNNNKFYDAIYDLIALAAQGLLYSNYCIEFNDKRGKIISEIILDIFLSIPAKFFKQNKFFSIFIKSKEKMTVFSIIDHYKEKIIERKKIKNPIKFPELSKMKEFHNIIVSLTPKQRIINLVDTIKIYQIEDINFLIYFLAKGFVYLRSKFLKEKENQIKVKTLNLFIPCLADDLYSLFTRDKKFYGTKSCGFPLYDETKKYFESYIVQNYNYKGSKNFDLYQKFFHNDLLVILKDEYDLDYCYSSRLYKSKDIIENEINNEYIEEKNDNSEKMAKIIPKEGSLENDKNDSINYMLYPEKTLNSIGNITNLEITLESVVVVEKEKKEIKFPEMEIKDFPNSFEYFNNNLILNPRSFFLKNIFSEAYKDIIFFNKIFTYIKKFYFLKYGKNKGVTKETKQKNYPTKQKNYSNFLEPRIFLKRDFNFYDKIYFPVSFCYLPKQFLNKKLEDIYFYQHKFLFNKKENILYRVCELVTNQEIYFGDIYFYDNYIIFESKEDPRNDIKKEFDIDLLMNYSISTKTIEAYPAKFKFIVIFLNNIQEVLKRRSLLLNQSIEIFLKNGKSFFFNFFKIKEAEDVYKYFDDGKNKFQFNFDINYNQREIKNILSQFHNGKISNYDYLLYLNKYSTRTYCDLSQYPVFPWILLHHENFDKIEEIDENTNYLRILKYPISVQDEKKRLKCITNFKKEVENCDELDENEEKPHISHFEVHYSNAAFIFYYLMRLNPYGKDLIKLQNYQNENPNRMFISFEGLEIILKGGVDNRELIPDFFCYFDFLINLNCNFLGVVSSGLVNDDFSIKSNKMKEYVHFLYNEKKLLNKDFISKRLHEWVDNIFGKNQLLDEEDDEVVEESCNIFHKYGYEKRINFEKELESVETIIRDNQIEKNKINIKIREIKSHLGMCTNFGMTPKQILKSTNLYETDSKPMINEIDKMFDEKILYYEKISNDEYLILKNSNKKEKNKNKNIGLFVYKNKSLSENKIYDCKGLNTMKNYKSISIESEKKEVKIPLYNLSYSISYLEMKSAKKNKYSHIIVLSCRYLGNYFNIQNIERNINVFCEDFVTCIKANNKETGSCFYTGLFNGKLIEWEIGPNFEVNEKKHIISHSSPITVIELYNRQNIIITACENNYINIRKQYDFELLTVINLNNIDGNPTNSKKLNIFPSLIKVSDLNLLYVLLYDLDSGTNFIRGYNLNGLFFAQTSNNIIKKDKVGKNIISCISFTKDSNLIIGFYNISSYILLQCWDLNKIETFDIVGIKEGIRMIIYEPSNDIFHILGENEFRRKSSNENRKLVDF